jgi:hypothetical protein
VFLAAVSTSTFTAAALMIPVALVASVSSAQALARSSKPGSGRGVKQLLHGSWVVPVGCVASLILPLMAIAGPIPAVVVMVILAAAGIFLIVTDPMARGVRIPSMVAALGPAVACMSVVLARGQGAREAEALATAICAYDMSAFVMGNNRTGIGGPIGVLSGFVAVGVVALFAVAVVDPPFSGAPAAVLFGVVALLAPAGVGLASWLAKAGRRARLPALRRVDSLLLAAPAWVIGVAVALHL